jgi:hypothetical protein
LFIIREEERQDAAKENGKTEERMVKSEANFTKFLGMCNNA